LTSTRAKFLHQYNDDRIEFLYLPWPIVPPLLSIWKELLPKLLCVASKSCCIRWKENKKNFPLSQTSCSHISQDEALGSNGLWVTTLFISMWPKNSIWKSSCKFNNSLLSFCKTNPSFSIQKNLGGKICTTEGHALVSILFCQWILEHGVCWITSLAAKNCV
jgi:hypothetical protein